MESKLAIAKSEPIWNTNNRVISIIAGLIILLFALPLFGMNSFYLHLFIMIFMHEVMAQSWNVIAGFSGQISLGHGAFFGIGAYATSFFYMEYGITPDPWCYSCLLYTSPSPRDAHESRMPSSA